MGRGLSLPATSTTPTNIRMKLTDGITLALAVVTFLAMAEARKSRGSSRGKGSSVFGKKSKGGKSSFGKKVVGGALVGAGAYAGYKATKAAAKFATLPFRASL